MITTMTKEQEAKVPIYLKKWLDYGYRTTKSDRQKAESAIDFLYAKILKMDKPKYYIHLDSPMACQLAANLIKNTKLDSNQLGNQLGNQLYNQLDNQLRNQLGNQLGNQLDNQLGNQLRNQLRNQLDNQLRNQKLDYFNYPITLWWWPGWTGFYDFVLHELFPEKVKEFELYEEFLSHWPELHYYLTFKDIVFISDFPEQIRLNENNQLHNFNGPALLYRDSYSIYSLNGVRLKDDSYIKNEITKDTILKEQNADIRRELTRKIGIEKTIELLGAKVIDTFESKIGGKYELLLVNYDGRGDRPYLKVKNPSMKDVWHIEGVKPETRNCKEALAWRNGIKEYIEPKIIT